MNTPILPLTTDLPPACGCGSPATWATRRGPLCDQHVHPAQRRLAQANARAAEMWGGVA